MIEFDVLPEHRDRRRPPVLAHDYDAADARRAADARGGPGALRRRTRTPASSSTSTSSSRATRRRVVEALREYGLLERSLDLLAVQESLDRSARSSPALRLGWSVPRLRRDYTPAGSTRVPALVALRGTRRRRCRAAPRARSATGAVDALMAHWRLVTPRLVRAVAGAGGELYVWTVDDADADPPARARSASPA